ncbi:hypothetical protein IEO21_06291 [Rhodonia placenta]|uniref:Uncharacterized protein n=1 Tax=Rhodonia placenta TaxID=104341 RepID=A0A8H7P0B6_9APHY|nr:hypothetical protein IEO21_06291 [Postia placenta]
MAVGQPSPMIDRHAYWSYDKLLLSAEPPMSSNDTFKPYTFLLNGDTGTDLPRPTTMQTRAADKRRTSGRRRACTGCCPEPTALVLGSGIAILALVVVGVPLVGAGFASLCSYSGLLMLRHKEGYTDADITTIYIASATGGAVLAAVVCFLAWVVILIIHWLREGSLELLPWVSDDSAADDNGWSLINWSTIGLIFSVPIGVCGQVVGYCVLQGRLSGGLDLRLALKLDGLGYLPIITGVVVCGGT